MPGRKYEAQSGYRYGFNGKEKDKDLNSLTAYDYGFRVYNTGIGKFLSVDPLSAEYNDLTPYQFASNMPIYLIDIDGLEGGYRDNLTGEIKPMRGDMPNYFTGPKILYQPAVNQSVVQTSQQNAPIIRPALQTISSDNLANQRSQQLKEIAIKATPLPPSPMPEGPSFSAAKARTPYEEQQQQKRNAYYYDLNGYNSDGTPKPLTKLGNSDGLNRFTDHVVKPMITIGTAIETGFTLTSLKGGNYAYRALTTADAKSLKLGEGIFAKAPNGSWTLEQHLIHGSNTKGYLNNPWIATTTDINIARSFSSGNGIIRIDLSKIPANTIERGWLTLPRSSKGYHFSVWQQEVSIFGNIPASAIKIIK